LRILVVTACGISKKDQTLPAYELYKSARIKAVYNRCNGCDMAILSGKYGLVDAFEFIRPYEQLIDEQRAQELVPYVAEKLRNYDCVIFFKGGARKPYISCISNACEKTATTLVVLGYANMGGINDLPDVIQLAFQQSWKQIGKIGHAEICQF